MTNQPQWKLACQIGDVDPVSYGDAYIYTDETGVYPPEMELIEPATDNQWAAAEDEDSLPVTITQSEAYKRYKES